MLHLFGMSDTRCNVIDGNNAESPNPWGGVPAGFGASVDMHWQCSTDCNPNRPDFPKFGISRVVLCTQQCHVARSEIEMARFMVSYDLSKPGRNYEDLFRVLRSFDHVKPLESVWFVSSHLSAADIRDKVRAVMDKNDHLMVSTITYSAWSNLSPEVDKWMAEHPARVAA